MRSAVPTNATILVTGETGTGKELVARAIHKGMRGPSGRSSRWNCAVFTETLLDGELFGHEKGGVYWGGSEPAGLV